MRTICLVIKNLGDRSGGAERLFCEQANWLAAQGIKVYCLTYENGDKAPFYPLDARVSVVNLYIAAKGRSRTRRFLGGVGRKIGGIIPAAEWADQNYDMITQLIRFFRFCKPNLVISYLPSSNTNCLIAGKYANVKVLPTNHNVPEQDYENPARWSDNKFDIKLRKSMLEHAVRIHVLFDIFGGWFGEHLAPRIRAVPNYVPDNFFAEERSATPGNTIVCMGRLAGVKNYEVLVRAWGVLAKDFPDWTVKIFGVGPLRKDLHDLARELEVLDSLQLMGHTRDVINEYDSAKIFCHPAIHEGFGLSVAEALARGVPVVAFADCEGVNQFVFDGVNGLMLDRSDEVGNLVSGLRTLMSDESKRSSLAGAARSSVESYTEEAYYKRWQAIIDEVLEA